jgi:hypothetical protein
LNLIHLLVAQWGDLYTNVGDLTHGALRSRDGEMIVHVGTENRQHLLGHMSVLAADIALGKIDGRTDAAAPDPGVRHAPLPRLVPLSELRIPPARGGWNRQDAGGHAGWTASNLCAPGSDEFSVENWSKAVRPGNTFMSSGPLLFLQSG